MRPIDADELLDVICRDQCERKYKDCDSTCEIAAYVVNAPTIGGWIRTKDKPPELPHTTKDNPIIGILVCDGCGNVSWAVTLITMTAEDGELVYFDGSYRIEWAVLLNTDDSEVRQLVYASRIVYWMPLPQPPKELRTNDPQ